MLPWNGHRSALTLTFDDTSPSQASEAVPVLDQEGVKGTFFVTVGNDFSKGFQRAWRHAEKEGHELGNHTVDHCRSSDLGKKPCLPASEEIDRCNHYIESHLGARHVYTFAYPYVDTGAAYKAVAANRFLLSRAGNGGLIDDKAPMDWSAMDARFIEPSRGETTKDWDSWIDESVARSKWLILVYHSLLPETWYEGVSKADLAAVIEHAKAAPDVWIDTFVDVGAYVRAEQVLSATVPVPHGDALTWTWVLPRHFPHGKSLKVSVDSGELAQAGTLLRRDAHGAFDVALDRRSLTWRPK